MEYSSVRIRASFKDKLRHLAKITKPRATSMAGVIEDLVDAAYEKAKRQEKRDGSIR